MSLRIFSPLAFAFMLAACGAGVSEAPDGVTIDCGIGPGAEYQPVCTLERVSTTEFVIHHPDGGFRRVSYDSENGLAVLDGAEPVISHPSATLGRQHFSIGSDGYVIEDYDLEGLAE